jgi:hypothetical protein
MVATADSDRVELHLSSQARRRIAALEDGLAHGSQIFPRAPQPGETVTLVFTANAAVPIDLVAVYYTTDGSEPVGARGRAFHGQAIIAEAGIRETNPLTRLTVREWRACVPGQPEGTLVQYRAEGWSVRVARAVFPADRGDPFNSLERPIFAYNVAVQRTPAWLDDSIIYRLDLEDVNSSRDTSVASGTLAGVLERLDEIQSLGVTCLWITPLLLSASARDDAPASHYYVADRYGTNDLLRRVIRAAHDREMKILLDFVAGSTSTTHPLFERARRDPQSAPRGWYHFGEYPPSGYLVAPGSRQAPLLATESSDVRHYVTTAAQFWLNDLGADGLALRDVTVPSHAFWTVFRRGIERTSPNALLLGVGDEAWPSLATYAGRLDAALDLDLAARLRRVFATHSEPLDILLNAIEEHDAKADGLQRATVLEGIGMERFLALANGEMARLRLALTCQLTMEGIPIVSSEIEAGGAEPMGLDSRTLSPSSGETPHRELLIHLRALAALRLGHPALRYGRYARLPVEVARGPRDAALQTGAYLRYSDADYLIVALNNTTEPITLRFSPPRMGVTGEHDSGSTPVLGHRLGTSSAEPLAIEEGKLEVDLPPLGAAVLGPQ